MSWNHLCVAVCLWHSHTLQVTSLFDLRPLTISNQFTNTFVGNLKGFTTRLLKEALSWSYWDAVFTRMRRTSGQQCVCGSDWLCWQQWRGDEGGDTVWFQTVYLLFHLSTPLYHVHKGYHESWTDLLFLWFYRFFINLLTAFSLPLSVRKSFPENRADVSFLNASLE